MLLLSHFSHSLVLTYCAILFSQMDYYFIFFHRSSLSVVKPFDVEVPRSMGMLANSWNLSMYRFLKHCMALCACTARCAICMCCMLCYVYACTACCAICMYCMLCYMHVLHVVLYACSTCCCSVSRYQAHCMILYCESYVSQHIIRSTLRLSWER